MFKKILIANRGEIAVRIIRACKEMGIACVAVHSTADKEGLWTSLADEAICIGGAASGSSYLNMEAIISAALVTGAQAIHPGFGFLSENANFAKKCAENNVIFIGPSPEVIEKMGDKNKARLTMKAAGVPIIPGSGVIKDLEDGLKQAEKIGYPILLKACSGGGGKGIRLVETKEQFETAFRTAAAEAQSNFGDSGIYIEKFLKDVKHIEMQIIGDKFGNAVCLGERDCSMQRRNQKLIEEAPANIPQSAREAMIKASIAAGKHVKYIGVGTIEYLFDPKTQNFYFMEMNTRLQVEHPVTEFVTQRDIVKWQIRVAAGKKLFSQASVKPFGHAIECRICNEITPGAAKQFSPESYGRKITTLHIPNGPWVRFDSAIYGGYEIPPFYDSMIGKLIVWSTERSKAIRKMKAALCELIIEGISHNADFHHDLLGTHEFEDTTYTTKFVEKWTEGREAQK